MAVAEDFKITPAWSYNSRTGVLTGEKLGARAASGYSGYGRGYNNPEAESEENVGPIPRGLYRVTAVYKSHEDRLAAGYKKDLGSFVVHLAAHGSSDTFGRDLFRVHHDNDKGDRSGSRGCIVMPQWAREKFEVGDYICVTS